MRTRPIRAHPMWVQIAERQGGSENLRLFQGARPRESGFRQGRHKKPIIYNSLKILGLGGQHRSLNRIAAHRRLRRKPDLKTNAFILFARQLHGSSKGAGNEIHNDAQP